MKHIFRRLRQGRKKQQPSILPAPVKILSGTLHVKHGKNMRGAMIHHQWLSVLVHHLGHALFLPLDIFGSQG